MALPITNMDQLHGILSEWIFAISRIISVRSPGAAVRDFELSLPIFDSREFMSTFGRNLVYDLAWFGNQDAARAAADAFNASVDVGSSFATAAFHANRAYHGILVAQIGRPVGRQAE